MTNQIVQINGQDRHLPRSDRCWHRFVFVLIILFTWICTSSCDVEFNPWQENEQYHFSIYGYLDASADTQWVRVMPVREDLLLEPRPIDFTVSLEHVETGEYVIMNDSLFSFARGTHAWNFWTTMELLPEHTYRLEAKSEDDRVSEAMVTLPADFPAPLVIMEFSQSIPLFATVFLEGVDRVADVRTVHGPIRVPHLKDTVRTAQDHFRIAIDLSDDLQILSTLYPGEPPGSLISDSSLIFIAAAGPDYHYFGSISEKVIALPEGVTNIENGTGYLAGFVSKTIPLGSCRSGETENLIPCDPEPPPW